MILDDGNDTVTFNPIREGYQEPQERNRITHKAMDGTLYVYEFADKKKWNISVNAITKANYDQILLWWQGRTELTFTPDEAVPATTYTVNIIDRQNPLKMMFTGWQRLYEGILTIREL